MQQTISSPAALALWAKLFRGFADPSRLAILDALGGGPLAVGELVATTGLSQSNTSNHLACLLECGLVAREQRGRYAVYSLADDRVEAVLALAAGVVADAAEGLYACTRYAAPNEGC